MRHHDSWASRRPLARLVSWRRGPASFILSLFLLLMGCSGFPRLVFLHDPLTAAEHVQLGIAYEEQGEWNHAMAEYQAALRKDHQHLPALVNLGNVHTQLRHYPEAERYYRKALKLDANHSMANNNLAWIQIIQGTHFIEAQGLIEKAIASDPDRRAVYLDTLAYLYLKTGQPKKALATIKEAEAHLPPGDESLKVQLATTHALIIWVMQSGGGEISTPPPAAPSETDRPEAMP